jgi:hypothetical protein
MNVKEILVHEDLLKAKMLLLLLGGAKRTINVVATQNE